jgi:hypothetical protein
LFFVLSLAALLWLELTGLTALLVLPRLATLLRLSVLSGLTAWLSLSGLSALLSLFIHIVCHEMFLLRKREFFTPSEFIAFIT